MKNKVLILLFILLVIFAFSSCKSNNEISTATDFTIEDATEPKAEEATDTSIGNENDSPIKFVVDTESSTVGRISFDIKVDGIKGDYTLFYADENGKVLPHYSKISSGTLTSECSTVEIDDLVLVGACKGLNININEENYFLSIPRSYQLTGDKYRFGALSDVHYNKGDYFNFALDFLDGQDVDFVGVAGDLTNRGELKYLEKFNEAIKNRAYKVYTVSGNHDETAIQSGLWKENVNTGIDGDSEVVEISENGLDFAYKPSKMDEGIFVFLCQTHYVYPDTVNPDEYTILDKAQLVWLRGVLEKYKDEKVFLFFHTFLTADGGDECSAVGNLQNPGGYEYPLSYTYGSADETEFRALMKEYKNVVYFSGHSHWMFEMEKYNKNLNISNFGGEYAYMVHVPSVCEPRWIDDDDANRTSKTGSASEGWIVDVYDDAIIFTPVDFIKEVYYTEYMKIIPLK